MKITCRAILHGHAKELPLIAMTTMEAVEVDYRYLRAIQLE
ncbi:hypothetical protein RBB77_01510 [Tunturibacter psychrotolerans]|uniref:Uncharacterized protein n=1 Tax=Tunturiibacter psychrotolerans TaxID=3069686 RepID=A0AAU7ZRQ3_9BACT